MKLKVFNKQKESFYNKLVKVTLHDGKEYIGTYDPERELVTHFFIGDKVINIKNVKTIELYTDNKLYKYVSVIYDDLEDDKTYYYKTDIEDIDIGDIVSVDRNGEIVTGYVDNIDIFKREDAPYPVEKTKDIIEVMIEDEGDEDYYFPSYNYEKYKELIEHILGNARAYLEKYSSKEKLTKMDKGILQGLWFDVDSIKNQLDFDRTEHYNHASELYEELKIEELMNDLEKLFNE